MSLLAPSISFYHAEGGLVVKVGSFFDGCAKMFPFNYECLLTAWILIIIIIRNVISLNNFYDDDSVCSPHQAAGADRRGLMVCPDVL